MIFRVELSNEAESEADAILEWLVSHHAGDAGVRWFGALEDAIASLSIFPERCPPALEDKNFTFEVRQLLYGQKPHVYRILFTIDNGLVYVLHLRHARRSPLAH